MKPALMAAGSAEKMARGGIYDSSVRYARYSVDAEWIVPHFEKMLYESCCRRHTRGWTVAETDPRRVATRPRSFIVDTLGTPEGGFAGARRRHRGVEGAT